MTEVYIGLAIIWLGGFVTGLLAGTAHQIQKDNEARRVQVKDLYPKKRGPDDAA